MAHHAMPFGATVQQDGVQFALYAPTAKRVDLALALALAAGGMLAVA